MTMFKYFLKNIYRLRFTMILYTIIFFIVSVLNVSGSSDKNLNSFKAYTPNISVVNESSGPVTNALISYIEESSIIKKTPKSLLEAKEMIFLDAADAVIFIPDNFEERMEKGMPALQILYDFDNMKGHIIENKLYKYLMLLNATEVKGRYDSTKVAKAMEVDTKTLFRDKKSGDENVFRQEWFRFYFNFLGYVILAIYIGLIGLAVSDFQQETVSTRIYSSSKRNSMIQMETYLGQLLVAVCITTFFILLSVIIQRGNVKDIPMTKYIINATVFSIAALSLTFMINNITGNRNIKNGLSIVFSLGTAFISGVMIPQDYIGNFTLNIAKFFPTYYFVKINDIQEINQQDLFTNLAIQLLFAAVFLILGIYFAKFKKNHGRA